MSKFLFIVNPVSGKGKGEKILPFVTNFLDSNQIEYRILISEYHLHTLDLVKNNANDFDTIVVAGGDGTLNEVITAVISSKLDKKIAILPIGSGNDFVKNGDFGSNIKESLEIITNKNSKILEVDVGLAKIVNEYNQNHEIFFINSLGIGFDAQVAYYKSKIKTIKGILSYLIAVLKTLLVYKPIYVNVIYENKNLVGEKLLCCIGNGISSGGGFYLTPDAKINDRFLDLCLVDNLRIHQIFRYLPLALLNKIRNVKIIKFDIFKSLKISLSNGAFVHADGELITQNAKDISIDIIEKKLKFICK